MTNHHGVVSEGARRVWRYQRVLWWMLVVNLVLAGFGTEPVALRVGKVADHSLHAEQIYQGFDATAFFQLASNPDVSLWSQIYGSLLFAFIFFIFVIFLTGGILQNYRLDRKLTTAEFFQACGAFFWRWVRLLIFTLIILTPIFILASSISKWSGSLADDAPQEKLGFWVEMVGFLVVWVLMMVVRLWFDMAQVRAVAENEFAMRRSAIQAFRLTFRNFGSLMWLYFRITILAVLGLVLAIWIWVRIPAQHIGLTFALFEVVLLWWMGTRLWQRASETVWYERHMPAPEKAPLPIFVPEPASPAAMPSIEDQSSPA